MDTDDQVALLTSGRDRFKCGEETVHGRDVDVSDLVEGFRSKYKFATGFLEAVNSGQFSHEAFNQVFAGPQLHTEPADF